MGIRKNQPSPVPLRVTAAVQPTGYVAAQRLTGVVREIATDAGKLAYEAAGREARAIGRREGLSAGNQFAPDGTPQAPTLGSDTTITGEAFNRAAGQTYKANLLATAQGHATTLGEQYQLDAEGFTAAYDEWMGASLDNIEDKRLRDEVVGDLMTVRRHGIAQISKNELAFARQEEFEMLSHSVEQRSDLANKSLMQSGSMTDPGYMLQEQQAFADIDAMVGKNLLNDVDAAKLKNDFRVAGQSTLVVREVQRFADAKNYNAAWALLEDIEKNPPEGMTLEDAKKVVRSGKSEISAEIYKDNQLRIAEDRWKADRREDTLKDLVLNPGEYTQERVKDLLERDVITWSDASRILGGMDREMAALEAERRDRLFEGALARAKSGNTHAFGELMQLDHAGYLDAEEYGQMLGVFGKYTEERAQMDRGVRIDEIKIELEKDMPFVSQGQMREFLVTNAQWMTRAERDNLVSYYGNLLKSGGARARNVRTATQTALITGSAISPSMVQNSSIEHGLTDPNAYEPEVFVEKERNTQMVSSGAQDMVRQFDAGHEQMNRAWRYLTAKKAQNEVIFRSFFGDDQDDFMRRYASAINVHQGDTAKAYAEVISRTNPSESATRRVKAALGDRDVGDVAAEVLESINDNNTLIEMMSASPVSRTRLRQLEAISGGEDLVIDLNADDQFFLEEEIEAGIGSGRYGADMVGTGRFESKVAEKALLSSGVAGTSGGKNRLVFGRGFNGANMPVVDAESVGVSEALASQSANGVMWSNLLAITVMRAAKDGTLHTLGQDIPIGDVEFRAEPDFDAEGNKVIRGYWRQKDEGVFADEIGGWNILYRKDGLPATWRFNTRREGDPLRQSLRAFATGVEDFRGQRDALTVPFAEVLLNPNVKQALKTALSASGTGVWSGAEPPAELVDAFVNNLTMTELDDFVEFHYEMERVRHDPGFARKWADDLVKSIESVRNESGLSREEMIEREMGEDIPDAPAIVTVPGETGLE